MSKVAGIMLETCIFWVLIASKTGSRRDYSTGYLRKTWLCYCVYISFLWVTGVILHSHTHTHTHWFNMEQNKVLLQGKFSVSSKPGKVYVVELTNQFLKFQDASCGRDTDAEGVIDLRDVIGCRINAGVNKQGRSTSCTCMNSSVVADRSECLLSVYFCPKKKKNSLSQSYQRRHCTLTLGLSQYADYNSNKTVCEKWRKIILSLSTENNNDITFNTGNDI